MTEIKVDQLIQLITPLITKSTQGRKMLEQSIIDKKDTQRIGKWVEENYNTSFIDLVVVKQSTLFVIEHDQVRKKFYHVMDYINSLPDNPNAIKLKIFLDQQKFKNKKEFNDFLIDVDKIPVEMVITFQQLIQDILLLPSTILYDGGTMGVNRSIKNGTPPLLDVTHMHNFFFNLNTTMDSDNAFRTGFILTPLQRMDFIKTLNVN